MKFNAKHFSIDKGFQIDVKMLPKNERERERGKETYPADIT